MKGVFTIAECYLTLVSEGVREWIPDLLSAFGIKRIKHIVLDLALDLKKQCSFKPYPSSFNIKLQG